MPTYSYRCTDCATAFDIQQAFSDDSLTECPTCGGRLRKLFNSIGVTFNGSGFYRTDSRTESTKSAGGSQSAPVPAGAASGAASGSGSTGSAATSSGSGSSGSGSSGSGSSGSASGKAAGGASAN